MLGHESGEVTIFSEMQQILLVQSIDFVVGVFLDEIRVNNKWFAFVFATVECLDTIQRETTGKTGHCAKETFE